MSLMNERSILILSNGKLPQIAQRRIAGAEVVHRDAHAELLAADAASRASSRRCCSSTDSVISSSSRCAGRPDAASALTTVCTQIVALELHRRDVDRDPDVVRPVRRLGAGRPQHPFAERIDQAGLLRDRNELGRRDHAALGMVPAQQRLAADDPVVADVDQRLVVQLELAAHERLAQVDLQRAARLHARVHLRLEEAVGAAAVGLGAVQRHVGVLQQLIRLGAVVRRHGDADAGVR